MTPTTAAMTATTEAAIPDSNSDSVTATATADKPARSKLLTSEQVCKIYEWRTVNGATAKAVAFKFGVSDDTVLAIWKGRRYANITGAERYLYPREREDSPEREIQRLSIQRDALVARRRALNIEIANIDSQLSELRK